MKQQITRMSIHQNSKVMAIYMTVLAAVTWLPIMLLMARMAPETSPFPIGMLLLMPLLYLIFGYVCMIIGCAVYNLLAKYIGGFEFEFRTTDET